ncbi:hypothetical protein EIP86_006370 [Pleurotus ostreatoroseus]|nr:hypothetical protein EIP86_006370 [Pleurotus ostreatoroseus]
MFHRRQTLSAIHDKSSAWLGLGSSAFALLRQKAIKTDLVGVIATALYLLCISVVHTAFPGIFTVESAESPAQLAAARLDTQQVSTVLAVQDTGFAAATGALIVCVFIIYRSQGFKPEGKVPFVDTTGVLPVIWLLGNEPRLAAIEEPKTNALRKAGMFEIESDVFSRIDSRVNLRARTAKGYESVETHDSDSVESHNLDGAESRNLDGAELHNLDGVESHNLDGVESHNLDGVESNDLDGVESHDSDDQ